MNGAKIPVTSAIQILLAILILCNVNGLAVMRTDSNRLASPLILLSAIWLLLSNRAKLRHSLSNCGLLYLAFVIIYLPISTLVALLSGSEDLQIIANEVLSNLSSVILVLVYAILGAQVSSKGQSPPSLSILTAVAALSAASALIEVFYPAWPALFPYRKEQNDRVCGFFANPNELGLVALVCLCLGTFTASVSKHTVWFYLTLAISTYAAFVSLSRTAMIGTAVLGLAGVIYLSKARPSTRTLNALLLALTAWVALGPSVQDMILRSDSLSTSTAQRRIDLLMSLIVEGEIDSETTGGRSDLAIEGIQRGLQSPLYGHGLTSMRRLPVSGLGPHNTFVRAFGEGGLLTLIPLILVFASIARAVVITKVWPNKVFLASALWIMLLGAFTNHEWLTDRVQNLLLGFAIGFASKSDSNSQTPTRALHANLGAHTGLLARKVR